MDKFPRDKQRYLLDLLYELKPQTLSTKQYDELVDLFGSKENLAVNCTYLYEHGLMNNPITYSIDGHISVNFHGFNITNKGIDFIRDDGGLSALLNITTIKIHDETLLKLEEIIKQSHLSELDKKNYIDKLRELPAETTKHLVLKLLDLGLSRVPDVLQLISSSIHF